MSKIDRRSGYKKHTHERQYLHWVQQPCQELKWNNLFKQSGECMLFNSQGITVEHQQNRFIPTTGAARQTYQNPKSADIVRRRTINVPILTYRHRRARLHWAQRYQQWRTIHLFDERRYCTRQRPCHTSRLSRDVFHQIDLIRLSWSALRPNHDPIKHMGSKFRDGFLSFNQGRHMLTVAFQRVWD